ncbi:LuxR C-terminal-related transcriptional regulator [Naasia sp. SYSU D00057]|uniref:LuxR C-terminal-related transcriptional regulator n=1 Tax=Naasia sp. SYSU D00057 TaxID=2817380 RepID=UPI0027DDB82F|nr:LuxR C-terminal-related transcriptional regulator [Naasia sp. SYSU D00057]
MRASSSGTGRPGPVPGTAAASALLELAREGRLVAGLTGPGGTGKSSLLDQLAAAYRADGRKLYRDLEELPGNGGRAALLIDDAHLLPDERIAQLRAALRRDDLDVLVAYRLWPDRPALRRLAADLEHFHPPVVLGSLTPSEIARAAAAAWGMLPTEEAVEEIRRVTGGQPWLVHRALAAGPEIGRPGPVPPDLLDQLGYELEGIDADLHSLLVALAVGFDLSGPLPASLGDLDGRVDQLFSRARHDGLLLPGGELAPLVREALLETTPAHRLRGLQRALLESYAAEGRDLAPLAESLARAGVRDRRVAEALEHSADHLLATQPSVAATLYREALDAGAGVLPIAARRAQALWATGEVDEAWRLLEEVFAAVDPPDAVRAANVAAVLWTERGMRTRAAETYRWLGGRSLGPSAPLAAVAALAAGERAAETPPDPSGSPALHTVAAALLEQGLRASLAPSSAGALPALVRASDMMNASGLTLPMPELPASVAALAALHAGDLAIAESVLDTAIAANQGGAPARSRLLLLRAWTAMQGERPERARAAISEAQEGQRGIAPRDELLLRALEVGLARRADDLAALVRSWQRARETVLHLPVDLFSLLPVGELAVAAARLHDSARVEAHVAEAWTLLERLGSPPLWAVPLHWSAVRAAILTDRPSDVAPHAAALVRAAEHSRPAAVLATAGRAWMSVLAGRFEAPTVESAARALATVGLAWDGSRLAGHAAAHSEDRRDIARLLACARDLHHGADPGPVPAVAGPAPAPAAPSGEEPRRGGDAVLSPREREVARLVLEGKNYREIGEAIFISPRTVEHHIARMRSRLEASTRSELLAQLRLALEAEDERA